MRMRKPAVFVVLLMLPAFACHSALSVGGDHATASLANTETETTTDFDVTIDQASDIMPAPGAQPLDVKYLITIANRSGAPVTIERIAMRSIGQGGGTQLPLTTRRYKEVKIGPNESAKLDFWATVSILDSRNATLPNVLRATIDFGPADAKRQESFVRQINQFSVGISGSR